MSSSPQFIVRTVNQQVVCTLPTPAESGVKITPERIWSQNAGRSSTTGKFVGDVIARKYTVTINYTSLPESEVQTLLSITDTTTPFWILEFPLGASTRRMNCYIAPPTYTVRQWDKEKQEYRYEDVALKFIEQ